MQETLTKKCEFNDNDYTLSHHFSKRMKERVNIKSKKKQLSFLRRSFERGVTLEETKGHSLLYHHLKRVVRYNPGCKSAIYNRYIIVSTEDNMGVTVLILPDWIQDIVDHFIKTLKRKGEYTSYGKNCS